MKSKIKSCITVALSLFFVIVAACFTTCSNSSSSSDDPVSQESQPQQTQPQNPPQQTQPQTPMEGCVDYNDNNGMCNCCAYGYTLINGICVQNPQ